MVFEFILTFFYGDACIWIDFSNSNTLLSTSVAEVHNVDCRSVSTCLTILG